MMQLTGLNEMRLALARYESSRRLYSLLPYNATIEEIEANAKRLNNDKIAYEKAKAYFEANNK